MRDEPEQLDLLVFTDDPYDFTLDEDVVGWHALQVAHLVFEADDAAMELVANLAAGKRLEDQRRMRRNLQLLQRELMAGSHSLRTQHLRLEEEAYRLYAGIVAHKFEHVARIQSVVAVGDVDAQTAAYNSSYSGLGAGTDVERTERLARP